MAKSNKGKLKLKRGILGDSSGTIGNIIVQGKVIRMKPDNSTKKKTS